VSGIFDLLAGLAKASAATPDAPVVAVGKTAITAGQLRGAAHAAPALVAALVRLAQGHASLADEELLADDAIAVALAAAGPAAAPFATIAPALANLFIEGMASGAIHPSPSPVEEGQTKPSADTHGHYWGR